jgi:hypothetical protein
MAIDRFQNGREVLYNILFLFEVHMKPVRLNKMCWNKTYSETNTSKYMFDTFPAQN